MRHTINRSALLRGLLAAGCVCVGHGAAKADLTWGDNLIFNGDAESGSASPNGQTVVAIPGWNVTGSMTVTQYAATAALPDTQHAGINPGSQFFVGGPWSTVTQAIQWVDLAPFATRISQGGARFELFGAFGGIASEEDGARMVVLWLDSTGQSLRTDTLLGPNIFERNGQTLLVNRRSEGILPSGTRSARVILLMTRVSGVSNDAYADDLRLAVYPGPCSDLDINNDGVVPDDRDVITLFEVFAGAPCEACDGPDFNDDWIFPDDRDIFDFLQVLAGGPCGDS
ncbi:MAG TPA: hypothetical protein VK157_11515 [Phycisphaerales bacterium]|nr:hypothetical protein [Phycisphaerales bacterium]